MSETTDREVTATEADVQPNPPDPEEIPTNGAGNAAPTGISTDPVKLRSIVATIASRIDSGEADHLTNQECREAAVDSGAVPAGMAPNHLGKVLKSIADKGFLEPVMKGDARLGYRVSEIGRQLIAEKEADTTRSHKTLTEDYLHWLLRKAHDALVWVNAQVADADDLLVRTNELLRRADLTPITAESENPLVQARQQLRERCDKLTNDVAVLEGACQLVAESE